MHARTHAHAHAHTQAHARTHTHTHTHTLTHTHTHTHKHRAHTHAHTPTLTHTHTHTHTHTQAHTHPAQHTRVHSLWAAALIASSPTWRSSTRHATREAWAAATTLCSQTKTGRLPQTTVSWLMMTRMARLALPSGVCLFVPICNVSMCVRVCWVSYMCGLPLKAT